MKTTKSSARILLASLAICLTASFAQAATIATWTFETSIPTTAGPLAPEVGAGSANASHADGATIYSNPVGNGSAESWSSDKWAVNDFYQFQVATTGQSGIAVDWDQTSSNTGPRDFELRYSTDNSIYTAFGGTRTVLANAAPNTVWSVGAGVQAAYHFSADLSSITGLDNQAAVYFRLVDISTVSASGGTVATAGTSRIDNFSVSTVPEPSTIVLAGLGLVGLVGLARRRQTA